MATLVNREFWAVGQGRLVHGKIESQYFDPDNCKVIDDFGVKNYLPTSIIRLSKEDVIPDILNEIEYWNYTLDLIQKEIGEDEG